MDKAKDELVRAYQYESDTHGLVVKDGLNIHIQVHLPELRSETACIW